MRPNVLPLDDIGLLNRYQQELLFRRSGQAARCREVAVRGLRIAVSRLGIFWRSLDPLPVEY